MADKPSDWALLTSQIEQIKRIKTELETQGYYDKSRVITKLSENITAIPVLHTFPPVQSSRVELPSPYESCALEQVQLRPSNRPKKFNLLEATRSTLIETGVEQSLINELVPLLSDSWFKHGDMAVLSVGKLDVWQQAPTSIWPAIASKMSCTRIALQEKISPDCYRTPVVRVVLGDGRWVEHIDNGVKYVFDVTQSMFSQGNVTEKMRMAQLDCTNEVIVDLFAGIGYFSLPLLVHGKAGLVHCCEWNSSAVEGLRRGLQANRVSHRCIIHVGDNREVAPKGVADRVILGLIPSSELSWPTACACLRPDIGGWLHVHGNVCLRPGPMTKKGFCSLEKDSTYQVGQSRSGDRVNGAPSHNGQTSSVDICGTGNESWSSWASYVAGKIGVLLVKLHSTQWTVSVEHIERVKSYAPHIDHLVLDLQCRRKDY